MNAIIEGYILIILSTNAGFDLYDDTDDHDRRLNGVADACDYIVDIREYDVPYHVRVAIDRGSVNPVGCTDNVTHSP